MPANYGSQSASSSSEALITGASIPAFSPSGEEVQAGRNRAVLQKKRREVSADWRRRAEDQGRPYAEASVESRRTSGRDSFSTSPSEGRPRRSSLAKMVVGRRPGRSASTSSPSESSEESDPAATVRPRAHRPDNANPFMLYDTDEEETDAQGRLVVHFPQINVSPDHDEANDLGSKPRRRISDIWKGLLPR